MISADTHLKTLIQPVYNLPSGAKPQWGKMTAQHMVEHLIMTLRMSNGKISVDCAYEDRKLVILKRFLNSDKPMPRNFSHPLIGSGLRSLEFPGLDEAFIQLGKEIEDFYDYFREHPHATPMNPTFGPLTFDEWLVFHRKHMTHHMTQFNLPD